MNPEIHLETVRRSPFRFGADGQIQVTFQETQVFAQDVLLRGIELPCTWDNNGRRRFMRHLRLSRLGGSGWELLAEEPNLDIPESDCPETCSQSQTWHLKEGAAGRVFRLEVLAPHPPFAHRIYMTLDERGDSILFSHLAGKFGSLIWLADTVGAPPVPANERVWAPPMKNAGVMASGADDITVRRLGGQLLLDNGRMRVGFALRRPLMNHFGWDPHGGERRQENLLVTESIWHDASSNPPWHGPFYSDANGRVGPIQAGGGTVSVEGPRIAYHDVRVGESVSFDAVFSMDRDGLQAEFTVDVHREARAFACEVWRWIWNLRRSTISHIAPLTAPLESGVRGRCNFPALVHAPGIGNLRVVLTDGDPALVRLRVDSHRAASRNWFGLEVGEALPDGDVLLRAGRIVFTIRMIPDAMPPFPEANQALARAWFSAFAWRPEMSIGQNGASVGCHFILHGHAMMAAALRGGHAAHIQRIVRDAVDLALRGVPAYGNPAYFMDSSPSIVLAVAILAGLPGNEIWARQAWPFLKHHIERILSWRGSSGLLVCRHLTGNSAETDWSCNWWDVVCFGHEDAYSNALASIALRRISPLAHGLADPLAAEIDGTADAITAAFWPTFYNPESGWVAGWRSADGRLHDHGFVFMAGIAVCAGLVPADQAKPLIERVLTAFSEAGFDSFHLGLPGILFPVPTGDEPRRHRPSAYNRRDGRDRHEIYQVGGTFMGMAYWFVRACGRVGIDCREMEEAVLMGFEERLAFGGIHSGANNSMWDGTKVGYEGVSAEQFTVLAAIAQNRRLIPDSFLAATDEHPIICRPLPPGLAVPRRQAGD